MAKEALQKNGIGLLGATILGVVMLSPAMTLYGGFGPAYIAAGKAAPLAFLWALFATLPTACSYIVLAKAYPTSGSASDWADKAFPRKVSVWTGWMVFLYYLTNFMIQPVTLGVFAGDLLKAAHLDPGYWTFLAGALVCLIWGAGFVYKGISISSRSALVMLLIETVVVTVLCISAVVFALNHGGVSLEGFRISSSPTGTSGIFQAMVFAILAFCGFDVVSTLAEETRDPEKNIPRATFLSLFIYAGIIIAGIWALTYGGFTSDQVKVIGDAGQMPVSAIAQKVWGMSGVLIPITGITATLGLTIATAIGASRVLFSMGRGGLASSRFAELSPAHKAPANALHAVFILGLIGSVITPIFLGPFRSYQWWGSTSAFFAMITYLMVNGSNLILNRSRLREGFGAILLYAVIPVVGLLVDLYLLYRTFFVELWAQEWAVGKSVVVFDVICCAIALCAAFWPRRSSAKA